MSLPVICKCCKSSAPFLGHVNFFKSRDETYYSDRNAVKPNPPEINIPYFRCQNCGFIFTNAMDHWSANDFYKHIYGVTHHMFVDHNDPKTTTAYQIGLGITQYFNISKASLRILDYGAGGNPGNLGRAFQTSALILAPMSHI